MRDMKQCERIELSLPASRDLMLVVRLTTSGVVARAGLTLDVLDDVKMAVGEACLCLLTQGAVPERLKLTFELCPQEIAVEIACEGAFHGAQDDAPQGELEVVRCILESLVDSVQMRMQGDRVEAIQLKAGAPNRGG